MSILERIEQLRKERKYHSWLGLVGISNDTIKAIKDGTEQLSDVAINQISKCENASLRWIYEGVGSPYRVAKFESDDECAEVLAQYLSEEAWTAYLVKCGELNTIVLSMPGSFERARTGWVEYTIVEVLTGAGLRAIAEAAMNAAAFKVINVDADTLTDLNNGQMGTYALLGDKKTPGILNDAKLVNMNERLDMVYQGKSFQPFGDNIELTLPEQALISHFRTLDETDKELATQLINRLR